MNNSKNRENSSIINILKSISDALFAIDREGKFTFVNAQAEQLFQTKQQSLIGKNIWEFLPTEDKSLYHTYYQQAIATQTTKEFEDFYPSHNAWFRIKIYPSGEEILFLLQNITERKQAEEKQRQSEAWYRRVVETAQEGIWTINAEGITDFVNPRMAEMLGYTVAEMLGHSFYDFMDEDARLEAEQNFERRKQEIKEVQDFRFRHRNGADVWTIISSTPILDEQGNFSGALATVTDVTERKQVEKGLEILVEQKTAQLTQANQLLAAEIIERKLIQANLQAQREFLEVVLDNVQAGIVACNAEGVLTLFNRATREFHGLPEQPISADAWAQYYNLYLPDGKTLMKTEDIPLFRALKGENVQNLEMMIIPKQGVARTLLASGRAIFNPKGTKQGAVVVMHDITERKKAEEALRENQARLAQIFKTVPDGIVIVNRDGQITEANAAAESILGLTAKQISDRMYNAAEWQITTIDEQPFPEEELPYARVMKTGKPVYGVEHAISYPHGERKILSINAAPICDATGNIVSVITAVTDITERKRIESALQASEKLLRTTFEQAPIGIALIGKEKLCNETNPAFQQMLGYSASELQNLTFIDITHPEDIETNLSLYQETIMGARDRYQLEKRYLHKNGQIVWGRLNVAIVRDCAGRSAKSDRFGNPQFYIAMIEDITEQKRTQEELLISDTALKQMPDAILLTDLDGNIQRWMGKAEQIFGYSAAEVTGKHISFLHHPDVKAGITPRIVREIEGTGVFFGEVLCIRKDGSAVPIEIRSTTVYDKTGKPLFLIDIKRDITERKRAEAQKEQLIQAQAARVEAEAAQQRSAFLAEASSVLTSSLDYEHTLKSLVQLLLPFLGDYCIINKVDKNRKIKLIVAKHHHPQKQEVIEEFAALLREHVQNQNSLTAQVISTGKPILVSDPASNLATTIFTNPRLVELYAQIEPKSFMILPLSARGHVFGTIHLSTSDHGRCYNSSDLSLAEELARRAGFAIDNANLYSIAQQARAVAERSADRTARLQAVTAALSNSLTPTEVVQVIIDQAVSAVGVCSALVALLDQSGSELEIVNTVGYDQEVTNQWRRFPLSLKSPLTDAIRTGEIIWEESTAERIARYPHLAKEYSKYDFGAWISIPLIVEGRAIGGMTLNFSQQQHLNDDTRSFILALSQQCAQAIERARLYEAERAARAAAETANRVKDEFLAIVSHELRTPLNSILGWAQMLTTRKFDQATITRAIEIIERNARSQKQLIEDLLDISRIIRGKVNLNVRPIDLIPVVQTATEALSLAAQAKKIQIHTNFNGGAGLISGDSDRLQQVMWNLLSNAVKFTPEGGKVDILLHQDSSHLQLEIKDTGVGISSDFLPHIFEYFRQADGSTTRSHGGLGLGLAIVRHLVELHGGTVEAFSDGIGKGTTFTVQLPLLKAEDEGQQPQKSMILPSLQISNPVLNGLNLLVVEDQTDTREFLTFSLEQCGAAVTSVASAEAALAILEVWQPDVLISDIGMPGEDGYSLIRKLRTMELQTQKIIPAIALTAYAGEIYRLQAQSAGFQLHISKPVEIDELIKAIANLALK